MIDNHDLDGHGGHYPSCRQCRLDKAIYALKNAEETRDGYVQVPVLGERFSWGGRKWIRAEQLAKELEDDAA